MNQQEYNRQYNDLMGRYEKASKRAQEIEDECKVRKAKRNMLNSFLRELGGSDTTMTEFSEPMWTALVEEVVVWQNGTAEFSFGNGSIVEAELNKLS